MERSGRGEGVEWAALNGGGGEERVACALQSRETSSGEWGGECGKEAAARPWRVPLKSEAWLLMEERGEKA